MPAGRRVVVTGIGVVSPLGNSRESFWEAVSSGRSGITTLQKVDPSRLRFANAAEIQDFDAGAALGAPHPELDLFSQYALAAAIESVEDAWMAMPSEERHRTAVVTGSCIGGQNTVDEQFVGLYAEGKTRVHPMTVPRAMSNASAGAISLHFGTTGPVFSLSTACASATHAIGHAFWLIRHGMADTAIAGGSEAPLSYGHLKAWEALRVVSSDTCRPFSRDRSGMVLGEGAAMLVLEDRGRALSRGATIYAEIVGFGMTADAHHITKPSVEGPAAAMHAALGDARVEPQRVGYINAHGTGTQVNDSTEVTAIRSVFGDHADDLKISATKSMHGHALGASGAFEAAATALALQRNLLPPTANFREPDPACDLDVIPNVASPCQIEYALSNSFAFGGLNAVLAFRHPGAE